MLGARDVGLAGLRLDIEPAQRPRLGAAGDVIALVAIVFNARAPVIEILR
jgi:hypothetical protein